MEKCKFCENLDAIIAIREVHKDDRFREKYYAKLHVVTERDLNKTGDWSECGSLTYRSVPLKFCPECGKKVDFETQSEK